MAAAARAKRATPTTETASATTTGTTNTCAYLLGAGGLTRLSLSAGRAHTIDAAPDSEPDVCFTGPGAGNCR
jgi:hypothetical protein